MEFSIRKYGPPAGGCFKTGVVNKTLGFLGIMTFANARLYWQIEQCSDITLCRSVTPATRDKTL